MMLAWVGVFLSGGLLYHGYFRQYQSDWRGGSYQWRDVAGFRPWLGPVFPLIHFSACSTVIIGSWLPTPPSQNAAVQWFVIPTIGMSLLVVGILYWFVLTQVLPLWKHKTLRVTRRPFLDADENFRYEEVISKWIAAPEVESKNVDPFLK